MLLVLLVCRYLACCHSLYPTCACWQLQPREPRLESSVTLNQIQRLLGTLLMQHEPAHHRGMLLGTSHHWAPSPCNTSLPPSPTALA